MLPLKSLVQPPNIDILTYDYFCIVQGTHRVEENSCVCVVVVGCVVGWGEVGRKKELQDFGGCVCVCVCVFVVAITSYKLREIRSLN